MTAWLLLPNYVKTFGIFHGCGAFWKVNLSPKPSNVPFKLRLGNRAVWLRNMRSDISIFFQIVVQREYDTRIWREHHARLIQQYDAFVEAGRTPIIIDAGANIGLASLWFADLFPLAKIYAVEPDPANFEMLRLNVAGRPNIVALYGAIWDRETSLRIENPQAGAASLRAGEGAGLIKAYTIPDLVQNDPTELFIVKIDIEGGEAALFRSNTGWFANASLTVLELHDWLYPGQQTSRNFLNCVSREAVDFVFRGENVFCFKIRK